MEIERYWPQPFTSFYKTKIDITSEELNQIKYILYNKKEKDPLVTTFREKNILDLPLLINLKKRICEILFKLNLSLDNSWAQLYLKGSHHDLHNHPMSMLSGIIYLDSKSEDGTLFYDYGGNCYEEKFEKNKLILFPSNFLHQTKYQDNDNERIVLAFNTNYA